MNSLINEFIHKHIRFLQLVVSQGELETKDKDKYLRRRSRKKVKKPLLSRYPCWITIFAAISQRVGWRWSSTTQSNGNHLVLIHAGGPLFESLAVLLPAINMRRCVPQRVTTRCHVSVANDGTKWGIGFKRECDSQSQFHRMRRYIFLDIMRGEGQGQKAWEWDFATSLWWLSVQFRGRVANPERKMTRGCMCNASCN